MKFRFAVASLVSLMYAVAASQNASVGSNSQKETLMSVNLVVSFNVKPERLQAFRDIMQEVKIGLPKVAGCRSVLVLNNSDNPLVFTLVETWDSKDVHSRHLKTLVDSGQWQQLLENLSAEPTSSYFTAL